MARFPRNDIISLVGIAPRYDLGESTGPDLHLGDLLDGSGAGDLEEMALGYGTAEGDLRLRQSIADFHGVSPEHVVVTVGGMHALFLVAFTLCGPGDEAVTTSPVFPPARGVLDGLGATVRVLPLSFGNGYRVEAAHFRPLLSPQTKLVSLASPQNPSGVAVPKQTIRELIAAMQETCPQAYLLLDETYREAVYGEDRVAASAIELDARVISVASLSKCHGAPGLRLGWAITRDRALRDQLVLGKFNTVVSCPPLDEALGLRVLQRRERIIAERRERLAAGLARTARWVREHASLIDWVRPDAGAFCCLRLNPTAFDDRAVESFHAALEDQGVRLARGTWFGDEPRVFRLGFGLLSMPDLDDALPRVAAALGRAASAAPVRATGDSNSARRVMSVAR